ncbi:MAG: pyrroline-5-carboxylate reductase [Pseudomonadota bacterium]
MRIALIGAGSMGQAMLASWLKSKTAQPEEISVFEPNPTSDLLIEANQKGVHINPALTDIDPDIFVLAIKPQMAHEVLPSFAKLASKSLTLSIMAGISCDTISTLLGGGTIVRGMPNLAVQVGEGVTGLYTNQELNDAQKEMVTSLVQTTGRTIWVSKESALDIVTAISGSGPAYFFLLAEALSEAAVAHGFSENDARILAEGTLRGAGALLASDVRTAGEWRAAVTSPGGVTAAALSALDYPQAGIRPLALDAVKTGAARAAALSK